MEKTQKTQTNQTIINKLNQREERKERKEKLTKIIICVLIALVIALLSWLNTAQRMEFKDEVIIEEVEEVEETVEEWEWYPWELNQSWDAQEMPILTSAESHQRFIELCEKYNLPADIIWHTENYYWLKEGTLACISIAETSGGKKWYGVEWCWNYWNIWNDDRGNRRCYPNAWAWLAAIWQTLKNDYLKNNQTIACLNWAWECIEPNASNKRYSTGKSGNRQRNLIACFYSIYQTPINPKTFNLHQR